MGILRNLLKPQLIRNTLNNKSTREDEIKYTYLKLPFINEEFKRRALSAVKRSGIDNVRIQFMNGKSSRRVFAPPRERTHCPKACETCKCTIKAIDVSTRIIKLSAHSARHYI
jgi:hypothetical protein